MKHGIDPNVDCVFKAIFGKEENKNLLIHFLNAVLEPKEGKAIKSVTIENPYNEKEFIGDKITIVDLRAVDEQGKIYQVEIQVSMHPYFTARILYTWCSIYYPQIGTGKSYEKLKPVISIWILKGSLFPKVEECHLPFFPYNPEHEIVLSDHMAIHVLQLPKWRGKVINEKDRWMYLFKKGKNIDSDNPPEEMQTKEMRQVMKVLNRFSESKEEFILYQNRLAANLERNTWLGEIEKVKEQLRQAEKEKDQAVKKAIKQAEKEKEQALGQAEKEKEQALGQAEEENEQAAKQAVEQAVIQAEIEKEQELRALRLLLKQKGIEPSDI